MGVPEVIYVKSNNVDPDFFTLVDAVHNNAYQNADELLKLHPDFSNQVIIPINQSLLSSIFSRKTIDYRMLDILVNHGVGFSYPINAAGDLPLDHACRKWDLPLVSYLVAHDVSISETAVHKLLCKAKDIKTVNSNDIKHLLSIIHQIGGLAEVSGMKDTQGRTFKTKAEHMNLSNESYGVIRYDLWRLLNLAESQKPDRPTYKILDEELALIIYRYSQKENADFSLGHSLSSLFGTGGMPIELSAGYAYEEQKNHNQKIS